MYSAQPNTAAPTQVHLTSETHVQKIRPTAATTTPLVGTAGGADAEPKNEKKTAPKNAVSTDNKPRLPKFLRKATTHPASV